MCSYTIQSFFSSIRPCRNRRRCTNNMLISQAGRFFLPFSLPLSVSFLFSIEATFDNYEVGDANMSHYRNNSRSPSLQRYDDDLSLCSSGIEAHLIVFSAFQYTEGDQRKIFTCCSSSSVNHHRCSARIIVFNLEEKKARQLSNNID